VKRALSTVVWATLFCIALSGCFDASSPRDEGPRSVAPDFTLVQLDGVPVSLTEQRGKTVILDFWATWCAPCEVQMPVLDTLWEMRGGPDLMILGISVDTDPAPKVTEWVQERELDYPIAIASQELAVDYGVLGFPTLVIIDPAGGIHTRHIGVLSRPELEEILDEIALESKAEG
jgi:cytochrome c biogenesis protein CcmG/thiol:disulfide interchange protein DsbE